MRLFVLLCTATTLFAHDIISTNLTFARDISRIFARRCVACHGEGSSIPLVTYEEARPWAVDIKEQVLSRAMPPWGAVKGFGHLNPDAGLTQEEIMIIAAWVIGGAPKGDAALLPKSEPSTTTADLAPLEDGPVVSTRTELAKLLQIAGIRPIPETIVESDRITARLPDGRVEPLLWLYHYDPKYKQTFRFRIPLSLPEHTVIEASAPLRFVLEN